MSTDNLAGFNQMPGVEAWPQLNDLIDVVRTIYDRAKHGGCEDISPDFLVRASGDRVRVTGRERNASPTSYAAVELFQVGGTWYVTHEMQRPTLEVEGLGGHVRQTVTYPLNTYEPATYTYQQGHLNNHGVLDGAEEIAFGNPLDQKTCDTLLSEMRSVLAPRVRGRHWLGWFLGKNRKP